MDPPDVKPEWASGLCGVSASDQGRATPTLSAAHRRFYLFMHTSHKSAFLQAWLEDISVVF